jgi:hypothetical protein
MGAISITVWWTLSEHTCLHPRKGTPHLPKLVEDLIERLSRPQLPDKDSDAIASPAAIEHGKLRRKQGYSSGMLIHESRLLQVTIFWTTHTHLTAPDFSALLPDVVIIADDVDSQLTQTMDAFTKARPKSAVA